MAGDTFAVAVVGATSLIGEEIIRQLPQATTIVRMPALLTASIFSFCNRIYSSRKPISRAYKPQHFSAAPRIAKSSPAFCISFATA